MIISRIPYNSKMIPNEFMNLLTKSYHIYTNFYNDKTEPYVRVVKADKLGIKTLTKKIDL